MTALKGILLGIVGLNLFVWGLVALIQFLLHQPGYVIGIVFISIMGGYLGLMLTLEGGR
jgi:hypothetical protein